MKIPTNLVIQSIVSALIASGLLAGPCNAAPPADTKDRLTLIVKYGDLNLDTPQGARTLYNRLRSAAMNVCAPLQSRELALRGEYRECYNAAISKAVGEVSRTQLTALYNASPMPRG